MFNSTPSSFASCPALLRRRGAPGFTTIELMIVVAIVAILAGLAAPSFSAMIAKHRAKNIGLELFSSLLRTRSEALVRNTNVTLSPVGGNWANGWSLPDPANAANILESRGAAQGATISGPVNLVYTGSGRISGNVAPMFVVAVASGSNTLYQCVSIDLVGRPYMKAAATC